MFGNGKILRVVRKSFSIFNSCSRLFNNKLEIMKKIFTDIPNSNKWKTLQKITEGWSNDEKYYMQTDDGTQLEWYNNFSQTIPKWYLRFF